MLPNYLFVEFWSLLLEYFLVLCTVAKFLFNFTQSSSCQILYSFWRCCQISVRFQLPCCQKIFFQFSILLRCCQFFFEFYLQRCQIFFQLLVFRCDVFVNDEWFVLTLWNFCCNIYYDRFSFRCSVAKFLFWISYHYFYWCTGLSAVAKFRSDLVDFFLAMVPF